MEGEGIVNFAVCLVTDLQESESHPIMIGFEQPTLPVTVAIGGCSSVPPNFSARDRDDRDAVELAQEVDMPPVAAHLAVGDGPKPDRLLPGDDGADAVVLDLAQRIGGRPALLEESARFGERRGAEQAADVIGSERGFRHDAHPPKVRSTSGTLFGIASASCTAGRAFISLSQRHARGVFSGFMISGNIRGTPATIE